MVIATIRMKKMKEAWSGNKKLHEQLVRKLEVMKKSRVSSGVGKLM